MIRRHLINIRNRAVWSWNGFVHVARTEGSVAMYIGNGHAAWEAALANTVAAGEKVLVPATGRFGHGWADVAEGLGLSVETLDFGNLQANTSNNI